MVTTAGEALHCQESLVRRNARERLKAVEQRGMKGANPGPAELEAIAGAEPVLFASSNPIASIEPVLELPGACGAFAAIVARCGMDGGGSGRASARMGQAGAQVRLVTGEE